MRWTERSPVLPRNGRRLALGLGLIGIGKPWGHANDAVPPEAQVEELLTTAMDLGVRFFDTAPSYGVSEERFGRFLDSLSPALRSGLTIATKFGEHWDGERQQPFVDHSYDALRRSLDGSLKRLGRIDVLELHKTTTEALESVAVERAFAYATSVGIEHVGASVSDLLSAKKVLENDAFSVVQFPFNPASTQYREIAQEAGRKGMLVLLNRPFGMGRLLYEGEPMTPRAAFEFLAGEPVTGVVLTGTKSAAHLRENQAAFEAAVAGNAPA